MNTSPSHKAKARQANGADAKGKGERGGGETHQEKETRQNCSVIPISIKPRTHKLGKRERERPFKTPSGSPGPKKGKVVNISRFEGKIRDNEVKTLIKPTWNSREITIRFQLGFVIVITEKAHTY